MTAAAPQRLKILCLHGWRTSGAILRKQVSGFEKALAGVADLEFMDAPFTATGEAEAAVTDNFKPPFYQWWDAQETETEEGTLRVYEGWKDSVDAVKSRISSSGPYHGVLGFSQGAAFASVLLALQQAGKMPDVEPFKFGIIVAGFIARDPTMIVLGTPIDTPTLHYMGEKDFMKRGSGQLLNHYRVPTAVWHPGGHAPPRLASEEEQDKLLQFVTALKNWIERFRICSICGNAIAQPGFECHC